MSEEQIEDFIITKKSNYGSITNNMFCIRCKKQEVHEVVERLNYENKLFQGSLTGCIGTSQWFDYQITRIFQSKEDFSAFMKERIEQELKDKAARRAYRF